MISPKTARRWRAILSEHPELKKLERPLLPLLCELQRLRLEGLDNDEIKVRMVEAIRLRGLLPAYDRLAERIREIDMSEKEPVPCQQKRIA